MCDYSLGLVDKSRNELPCGFAMHAGALLDDKRTDSTEGLTLNWLAEGASFSSRCFATRRRSTDETVGKVLISSL
jgi:hypothetical protein